MAVVDRVLPDGDGAELGVELAAAGVPSVALSGLAYPGDAARILAAGFVVHLPKPATVDEVVGAIAAAVARRPTP